MPKIIDVPGLGRVEFPDDMSDAEISAALAKNAPITDEQLIEAAESPTSTLFEQLSWGQVPGKGVGDDLKLYERYRKLKAKEGGKWDKFKKVLNETPQLLGMVRDEIWEGIKQPFEEGHDAKKHGRTLVEGFTRGTNDLMRMLAPFMTSLRAEDTYEKFLKEEGLSDEPDNRARYTEILKGDFADFMMFRNWDKVRDQIRRGEKTFIDRSGLSGYIGSDIYDKLAEAWSYPLDPASVAGGVSALVKVGAKGGAKALAKGGAEFVGGAGTVVKTVAEVPEKALGKAASVVAGKEAGEATTSAASAAVTATTVAGSGATAPFTAGKVVGRGLEAAGEVAEAAAETAGKAPLPGGGVFEQIAKRRGEGKLATAAKAAEYLGLSKAARVAGGVGKGVVAGSVVGGVLASGEALREKDIIETAIPGIALGAALGSFTGGGVQALREVAGLEFRSQVKRSKAEWMAEKGDVEIARLREAGLKDKDFDRLSLIEQVVAGVRGDDVLFAYLTDDEFKVLSGGKAQGTFMYEGIDGRPTVAINLERAKKPGRTIYHEIGHALDMLDFEPEAKRHLDELLFGRKVAGGAGDPEVLKAGLILDEDIPRLVEEYGLGNLALSSDNATAGRQMREAIGRELRAEAWANMLEGKPLRKLGANGVISRIIDGVMLADADKRLNGLMQAMIPGTRSGSEGIFTIGGKAFHNTPEVNKLLTSMFRAKRRLNRRVTLQENATSGSNIITQKDFTPKTSKVLTEVFKDSDIFERNEFGEILNQNMQPLHKHGGMPKFLDKAQRKKLLKDRAAAIHQALINAGTPEPGTGMDRLPFFLFNDPAVREQKRSNGLGAYFNDAQMAELRKLSPQIMPSGLLAKLEILNAASREGGGTQFAFMYNAALKDTGKYSSRLSNEYRQGVVLDFEITKVGNLNVRTLDMVALHNRLSKLAGLKKGDETFWEPWGGREKAMTDGEFMQGFFSYLDNHKKRVSGDKTIEGWTGLHSDEFKARRMRDIYNELIGWRGRDEANPLFGTLFAEKDNPLKSRRLDRINDVTPLDTMPKVFINQQLQRQNLMPEAPVIRDLSELGNGTPGRTKFEDKPHPRNEATITLPDGSTTHSRTRPSRDPLGPNQSSQIPAHLRFENVEQMMTFVDRGVTWLTERMGELYVPGEKWFYEKMYLAGARLAGDAADKTDLYTRFLAYLSPRTAVPANFTKSFGSGISTFMSEVARGNKAGSLAQIRAISQIIDEWTGGKPFGDKVAGVDNKVENFYLNGMAEMLRDYGQRGKPVPKYLLQDPRFTDPIELSRLSTNDMWHMAAMAALDPKGGNVWPGFVLKKDKHGKTTGFAWSDTRVGRRVRLDSAEGKKVMKHLSRKGEKGSKKPDPDFGIPHLTKQELESLDYKSGDNSILVFDDKTDAGLNAKGEGPLYDHVQMITGLMADQINAEGGIAGRPTVDAYNIQELMWAAIKMDNPLKEMRDYESYLAPVDEFLKYVESGLESEMPKSIKASTASYDRWAKQLVSGEIDTQQASLWAKELEANRDRLAAQGVADPDKVIVDSIAEGLPMQVERIAAAQGLDARVDTVRTDMGAYMGDNGQVETNWAIYVEGRGADFGKIDNMLRGAGAQQGGNHIRPLKVEEKALVGELIAKPEKKAPEGFGENLSVVMEMTGAADMGPAEVKALVADLSALKDGNGNSFLSGLSKIDDEIVIHDGYYRGSWQSDGSFKRDSYFDKKAANFENEVGLSKPLIEKILQKHGLTFRGLETKLVRAETNPYIKSGKDTIKGRKANLNRPASRGRKSKPGAEAARDIQAVSLLRGHFFDASRSAEPSQKAVKYDADQLAEIRKTITRSSPSLPKRKKPQQVAAGLGWGVKKSPPLPAGLPKLSKAQNDSFRQLGSDAGVLSAVANSDLVPSSIDPGMAAKVFDSVMAIAEGKPAKLLEKYDKEFIDLQTPFLSKMLKQGVKDLTADSIEFKQKYQRTIRDIESQLELKRSNKPKLKTQHKSATGTLAKREAANDKLIKKAEADGIITRNQAVALQRRIGAPQSLMPDSGEGKARKLRSDSSVMPSDVFKPTEEVGKLKVMINEQGYRVTSSVDGKYRLYNLSGALVGVAASKASLSALYKRRVISRRN